MSGGGGRNLKEFVLRKGLSTLDKCVSKLNGKRWVMRERLAALQEKDSLKAFAEYASRTPIKKLHLGYGGNLIDDWFNTDYKASAKSGIPQICHPCRV